MALHAPHADEVMNGRTGSVTAHYQDGVFKKFTYEFSERADELTAKA